MTTPGTTPETTTERPNRRTAAAIAATVTSLAAYNVIRTLWLPGSFHLLTNAAMVIPVMLIAHRAGLSREEMGLGRDRMGSGTRWGVAAFGLILLVVVGAAIVARTLTGATDALSDDRVRVDTTTMLFKVLLETPFGTVLLEEIAFRGSLLALFRRCMATWRAVVTSSLLFGCWHILPTISTAPGNTELASVTTTGPGLLAVVAGSVASTAVAGVAFCWLRLRSGSLLAPAIAHVATNDVSFVVAWWVTRV